MRARILVMWRHAHQADQRRAEASLALIDKTIRRIPRNAYLFIPDLWFKLERKAFRIELEAAAY